MDGVAIGQAVEDMVLETYVGWTTATIAPDDLWVNWYESYHERSMELLAESPDRFYQPSFLVDDVFVKADLLVLNEGGTYDLIEIKAKNGIRKKTKAQPLLPDLIADVSLQVYVLKRALWEKFSWKAFIAYLNKEYIKIGPINPQLLVIKEDVTEECMEDGHIEMILTTMRESLSLWDDQFESRYPYTWTDYMTYFGQKPPKDSIRSLTRLHHTKKAELFDEWKVMLEDLDAYDVERLKSKKWDHSKASNCLELRMNGDEKFDKEAIQQELNGLQYPLYFYDYETVSTPIPQLDGTSPRQQVVVQYSLHKMLADWTYTHHEAIIHPWETTNERLLKQLVEDFDHGTQWSFIVWNKWFECARNTERSKLFPDYKESLENINTRVYDLMDIFSKQMYYHRKFEWSASIKKVLPVMSDISYDDMKIPNWWIAMEQLSRIVSWELEWEELQTVTNALLEYCKLDTWAMVAIWKKLKEVVE